MFKFDVYFNQDKGKGVSHMIITIGLNLVFFTALYTIIDTLNN